MIVYKVKKSKLSKCLAVDVSFILSNGLSTSVELSTIQKQLAPEFLTIPSLYSCMINLRHLVSILDNDLVVQLLEAAINLLPIGVLCIFGSVQDTVEYMHIWAYRSNCVPGEYMV